MNFSSHQNLDFVLGSGADMQQVMQTFSVGFPDRNEFYVKCIVDADAFDTLMCAGLEDMLRSNLDLRDNDSGRSCYEPAKVLRIVGDHDSVLQCLLCVTKGIVEIKNGATPGELELQEPDLSNAPTMNGRASRNSISGGFNNKRNRDDDGGGARKQLKVDDETRAKQLTTTSLQRLRDNLRSDKQVTMKGEQIKTFNTSMFEPLKMCLEMHKNGDDESAINDHLAAAFGEALVTCEADSDVNQGGFEWSITMSQELADLCTEKMFRPTVSPYSDAPRAGVGPSRDYSRDGLNSGRNADRGRDDRGRGGGMGNDRGGRSGRNSMGMAPMAFPSMSGGGSGRGGGRGAPLIPRGRFDMAITNDQAGSLLRNKGDFINHVRKRSMATVTVSNKCNHDDLRDVSIEGDIGQVSEATHMLFKYFEEEARNAY